jgi:hypothetical protein
MPRLEDSIEALRGSLWFSVLDLESGYHQIALKHSDQEKTAFITQKGIFKWKKMPFGLVNAPFTFQIIMDKFFKEWIGGFVQVYIDDIIIYSKTVEEHLSHLNIIFKGLNKVGFKVKAEKCHLLKSKVNFLGFDISNNEMSISSI